MELELIHLAGYLPYGLKFMPTQYNKEENKLYYLSSIYNSAEFGVNGFTSKWIKPILRPLADLTKEIDINGEKSIYLVEIMKLKEKGDWVGVQHKKIDDMPFYVVQKLLEWHFDIYGLIEKGLAIDVNTLN